MKKYAFILLAIFSFSFTTYAADLNIIAEIAPSCQTVGNVSVTVDESTSTVKFENYNEYSVTVFYKVIGYKSTGQEVTCGSGTVSVGEYMHYDQRTGPGYASTRFTKMPDITSYGVISHVQKCD